MSRTQYKIFYESSHFTLFINKPTQQKKNANQRDFYLTAVSWTAALQDLRNQTQKLETS